MLFSGPEPSPADEEELNLEPPKDDLEPPKDDLEPPKEDLEPPKEKVEFPAEGNNRNTPDTVSSGGWFGVWHFLMIFTIN